jgi:uncharacterized protein
VTAVQVGLVLLAAIAAGAMNAVVGAGTLVTFPTLLALGLPPVVANVSNTVGLVPGSVAGAYAYRHTLTGRAPLLRRLVGMSAIGGVVGAALLVALPAGAFDAVVPPLLLGSAGLAALQPRVARMVERRRRRLAAPTETVGGPATTSRVHPLLLVGVALTGVYGGYFGAAQGVILLALLGMFVEGGIVQVNGIKNVLAGLANLVSAALFLAVADVDWVVAGVVGLGATIGGGLGGRYGRRLSAPMLRAVVVVIAVTAAAWRLLARG